MTVDVLTPRPLGETGWMVTGICVGTGEIGAIPVYGAPVPAEQAVATARRAFAGPLNFVDTSNGYGVSEERLGAVLDELGRAGGPLLATKVDPEENGPFDRRRVLASAQESMGRLGLDHLPLLYIHDPERIGFEQAMAPDGPVAALRELVIRGTSCPHWCRRRPGRPAAPFRCHRKLSGRVDPQPLDPARPFGRASAGGLRRRQSRGRKRCSLRRRNPGQGPGAFPEVRLSSRLAGAARGGLRHTCNLCAFFVVPMAAVALQHSLREPRITSTIVGMSRPERYDEALALAAHPVPDELWPEVEVLTPGPEHWLS